MSSDCYEPLRRLADEDPKTLREFSRQCMKEKISELEKESDFAKDIKKRICLTDKSMGVGRVKIEDAKFFPEVPSYYKLIDMTVYHLLAKDADDYIRKYEWNGLSVIASVAIYGDKEWLHVSFSRKSRIPDYNDIQRVRRDFIGEDKKCFMVFPKKENYVNIHKYCLHLWYSEDADIPDFEVDIPGIGKSI